MELCVAQSFSKNMGLYGERIGAFHLLVADPSIIPAAQTQLVRIIRSEVSCSVSFAARAVAAVLTEQDLKKQWREDLITMSTRMKTMRKALRDELEKLGTPGRWNHVTDQVSCSSYSEVKIMLITVGCTDWHVLLHRPINKTVPGDGRETSYLYALKWKNIYPRMYVGPTRYIDSFG